MSLLGSPSPQSLVDTMVFMSALYFALRSGDEHRNLHFSSVKLVEKEGTTPYLIYTETVSKNNAGGLKHRKVEPKQVKHFANTQCSDHCFVEMYKKYCFHRPKSATNDAFYLAPILNPKGTVWYKNQAIGVNSLANTVKQLCENGGINGYTRQIVGSLQLFSSLKVELMNSSSWRELDTDQKMELEYISVLLPISINAV